MNKDIKLRLSRASANGDILWKTLEEPCFIEEIAKMQEEASELSALVRSENPPEITNRQTVIAIMTAIVYGGLVERHVASLDMDEFMKTDMKKKKP